MERQRVKIGGSCYKLVNMPDYDDGRCINCELRSKCGCGLSDDNGDYDWCSCGLDNLDRHYVHDICYERELKLKKIVGM